MREEKTGVPNHCRPVIISGEALLMYLAGVILACGLAFGAGWMWREGETRHLVTVQEVTEIQDGMREEIGELRAWRKEVEDRMGALQASANAAGWGRVKRESKVQSPKPKVEY